MAHRHKMQARARGGRTGFASGGMAGRTAYNATGSNVLKEAKDSSTDGFKRGGGVDAGYAFGGAAKKHAGRKARGGPVAKGFKAGGSVWSSARSGIGGPKAFAAPTLKKGSKTHGEPHDSKVRGTAGAAPRGGHGGKAAHQYAEGGAVKKKEGGPVPKRDGGECEKPEKEKGGDDEEEEEYATGGVTTPTYKRGGKLKMHYVGGKGRKGRAEGGAADHEPDADADDYRDGGRAPMAKGGGCWMEKAFAHSHGQFKAKAKKAGESTEAYADKQADNPRASTKTKRQANLAKIGAEYGGG